MLHRSLSQHALLFQTRWLRLHHSLQCSLRLDRIVRTSRLTAEHRHALALYCCSVIRELCAVLRVPVRRQNPNHMVPPFYIKLHTMPSYCSILLSAPPLAAFSSVFLTFEASHGGRWKRKDFGSFVDGSRSLLVHLQRLHNGSLGFLS